MLPNSDGRQNKPAIRDFILNQARNNNCNFSSVHSEA